MSAPATLWLLAAPLSRFTAGGPGAGAEARGAAHGGAAFGTDPRRSVSPAGERGAPGPAERERAAAFTSPAARERFLAGRALLRAAGSAALGVPAARLRVVSFCPRCGEGGHGAPTLVDAATGAALAAASLSRAAGWGLAAVAPAGWRVGVDLVDPEDPAFKAGGPGYVAPAEAWARGEAVGKARGEGLVPVGLPDAAAGAGADPGAAGRPAPGGTRGAGRARAVPDAVVHRVPGTRLLCALSAAPPPEGEAPRVKWLSDPAFRTH
ncbi:hypothetical protein DWB68_12310 [Galactobacter valiniphilus]|uniref:Uncharacterized protein n=1 Tax=Galactobacter valiniphilus TaxID=2676122 RepID=A0A399J858_9MICC|nr:hypothetical protein [Galactobacter valiniphilus]RII41504.1 hypothetical protein DWB68_12310 [Galactobacter valiniphilus]